jgi:hypothetical protein
LKLIFCNQENPTATFVGVLPASSKDGNGHARVVYHCYGDQYFLAIVRRGAGLGGLQGAAAGDDAYGGYWFLRTGVCEMPSALRSNVLAKSAAKSILVNQTTRRTIWFALFLAICEPGVLPELLCA